MSEVIATLTVATVYGDSNLEHSGSGIGRIPTMYRRPNELGVYAGLLLTDKWKIIYTVRKYENGIVTLENAATGKRFVESARTLFTQFWRI